MTKSILVTLSLITLIASQVTFAQQAQLAEEVTALAKSPTAREAMQRWLNLSGEALNAENLANQLGHYGAAPQVEAAISAYMTNLKTMSPQDAAKAFTVNGKVPQYPTQLVSSVDSRSTRVTNLFNNKAAATAPTGQMASSTCDFATIFHSFKDVAPAWQEAAIRASIAGTPFTTDCNGVKGVGQMSAASEKGFVYLVGHYPSVKAANPSFSVEQDEQSDLAQLHGLQDQGTDVMSASVDAQVSVDATAMLAEIDSLNILKQPRCGNIAQ